MRYYTIEFNRLDTDFNCETNRKAASLRRIAAGSILRLFGVWGIPNKHFCMNDRQG